MLDGLPTYWYSRFLFQRGLAALYLVAFLCAANQFVPLLGDRGLLPVARFVRYVPFRASPSLFYAVPTDRAFRVVAWLGVMLSLLALSSFVERRSAAAAAGLWACLWLFYLSFVNVGQVFYSFGWETLLLEAGFFTIFAGGFSATPSVWWTWIWRWLLFRLMFGAGLIKLRGDPCWRDLTCLNYYFETQPIPNALSWYFHWLPEAVHRAGVAVNHIVEVGVPFAYFAPQPIAAVAALATIGFQLVLIVSGNLSWLNWLTIVVALPLLHDRWLSWLPVAMPSLHVPGLAERGIMLAVVVLILALSINPARNLLSTSQMMNSSFEPLHLVNTYGAFGSITRTRDEIVIEGTDDSTITPATGWKEYEFKGKPGDPSTLPRQIAPYHLRLDWLMWFAAMSGPDDHPWFAALMGRLLEGDRGILSLLRTNPFPDRPPRYVRALYYEYHFTTPDEHRQTGKWWNRRLLGEYFQPVALTPASSRR